jgi:hypothetical protein
MATILDFWSFTKKQTYPKYISAKFAVKWLRGYIYK